MNRTTTVLLVSAAVVVGIVITGFTAVMFTPAGYMLFGMSPMWGHTMSGWGTMMDSHRCGCLYHSGHGTTAGPGMMHSRCMMGGPGMMGGHGSMAGPGMMHGRGMIVGPDKD